jgi:hypothetical protein
VYDDADAGSGAEIRRRLLETAAIGKKSLHRVDMPELVAGQSRDGSRTRRDRDRERRARAGARNRRLSWRRGIDAPPALGLMIGPSPGEAAR